MQVLSSLWDRKLIWTGNILIVIRFWLIDVNVSYKQKWSRISLTRISNAYFANATTMLTLQKNWDHSIYQIRKIFRKTNNSY